MSVLNSVQTHYLGRFVTVHRRLLAVAPHLCGVAWANRMICTILDGRPLPADAQQWAEELESQAQRFEELKRAGA